MDLNKAAEWAAERLNHPAFHRGSSFVEDLDASLRVMLAPVSRSWGRSVDSLLDPAREMLLHSDYFSTRKHNWEFRKAIDTAEEQRTGKTARQRIEEAHEALCKLDRFRP